MLSSFHLNGHTIGFYPLVQTSEPRESISSLDIYCRTFYVFTESLFLLLCASKTHKKIHKEKIEININECP